MFLFLSKSVGWLVSFSDLCLPLSLSPDRSVTGICACAFVSRYLCSNLCLPRLSRRSITGICACAFVSRYLCSNLCLPLSLSPDRSVTGICACALVCLLLSVSVCPPARVFVPVTLLVAVSVSTFVPPFQRCHNCTVTFYG